MAVRWKKIFAFSGSIVAYLIGSGFASGQEAMQFLSSFGLLGCAGAVLMTTLFYFWFCSVVMADGYRLKLSSPNEIFRYYCGKHLGLFFEIYTPIFLFLVYIIMLAGAGAILEEHNGLSPMVGRTGMALFSVVTVMLGLDSLVSVISKIGPLIILFVVIVGIANISLNPGGILLADEILAKVSVTKAAPTWYIAGLIFPAMGCVMIMPFLASLGTKAENENEARAGGLGGALTFSLATAVMAFGLLADIGKLYDKKVPALIIADRLYNMAGNVFAVILLLGVYSTSVPMLWLTCNRIAPDEKSIKFKLAIIVLTIIAFFLSQFSFISLVNIFYPITGYLGVILLICTLIKRLRKKIHSMTGTANKPHM